MISITSKLQMTGGNSCWSCFSQYKVCLLKLEFISRCLLNRCLFSSEVSGCHTLHQTAFLSKYKMSLADILSCFYCPYACSCPLISVSLSRRLVGLSCCSHVTQVFFTKVKIALSHFSFPFILC